MQHHQSFFQCCLLIHRNPTQTAGALLRGFGETLPEDRDAEIVSSSDVRSLDVVTEQDQSDEQVVDVGFVNRKEDHGHVLL